MQASQRVNASPHAQFFIRLRELATDIKLSHSIFALPFALLSTFLAAGGVPPWIMLALILICMVTARSMAMLTNRLLDARLDALNPRTANRAIPAGRLSRSAVLVAIAVCVVTFVLACAGFWIIYSNPWPLVFSIPVLVYLAAYPLMKRFTRLCHYYLGVALALAPICAWVAVSGEIAIEPLLMAAAVALWTGGFDIIYACQDEPIDRQCGLHSIPAKLGIANALWISRLSHLMCVGFLVALGWQSSLLGTIYFIAVVAVAGLLICEHAVVRPDDLSRVGLAFFTLNGVISVFLGTMGIIDIFVGA